MSNTIIYNLQAKLPDTLATQFKIAAQARNMTVTEATIEALASWIETNKSVVEQLMNG